MGKGNGFSLEQQQMTDIEFDGAYKKWKIFEIVKYLILVGLATGLYLAGFETATHAEATYLRREVYLEHIKSQDQQYQELMRRTQENQQLLLDIQKYLRKQK